MENFLPPHRLSSECRHSHFSEYRKVLAHHEEAFCPESKDMQALMLQRSFSIFFLNRHQATADFQ
jgi:hypothetical protein